MLLFCPNFLFSSNDLESHVFVFLIFIYESFLSILAGISLFIFKKWPHLKKQNKPPVPQASTATTNCETGTCCWEYVKIRYKL